MLGIFIIPTGIGCKIGGHAGDATPAAKLIAACCDKLIIHPNVVNASDINEMTDNMLYVEGSMLDRFLEGKITLKPTKAYNKILLVANSPITKDTINAANAARVTIGADIEVLELEYPLKLFAEFKNGTATGEVDNWEELIEQVKAYDFDVLAIHTPIILEKGREVSLNYFENGGINPWGGVEAKASKLIADKINKPVAHAPIENSSPEEISLIHNMNIDPRMAPETLSKAFLHCVLKGLHKAPRIGKGVSVEDVDFMVSPWGCFGRPHIACTYKRIPVIIVRENETIFREDPPKTPKEFIFVENYLEAAGVVMSMKAGVNPVTIRSHGKGT